MTTLDYLTHGLIDLQPDRARPISYREGGKRLLDLGLALLVLPLVLPLVALLWILVRLDGGPGFYGQERVGRGGRIFRCWKLRTMRPDAEARLAALCASDPATAREWEQTQKLRHDPRVTWLGQLLRKSSLDELPQIFNILRGEMSFVGPRPFMASQLDLYLREGGRGYFRLRPGLTGLWQVRARQHTAMATRVLYDTAYANRIGLWQDVAILLRTVPAVLSGTGR